MVAVHSQYGRQKLRFIGFVIGLLGALLAEASISPAAMAQSWTPAMEATYQRCLQKYGDTFGDVGCQCNVEQIAVYNKPPLAAAEYCKKYYIR